MWQTKSDDGQHWGWQKQHLLSDYAVLQFYVMPIFARNSELFAFWCIQHRKKTIDRFCFAFVHFKSNNATVFLKWPIDIRQQCIIIIIIIARKFSNEFSFEQFWNCFHKWNSMIYWRFEFSERAHDLTRAKPKNRKYFCTYFGFSLHLEQAGYHIVLLVSRKNTSP